MFKLCQRCNAKFETIYPNKKYCCPEAEFKNCKDCGVKIKRINRVLYCTGCSGKRIYENNNLSHQRIKKQHASKSHWSTKACLDCTAEFKSYNGRSDRCRNCQNIRSGNINRKNSSKRYWGNKPN